MNRTSIATIPAFLLFAACGGDTEETEALTERVTAFGTEIQELTELADAHHTTVAAAAALGDVATEESAYQTQAALHHDELHHAIGDMELCSRSGQPPSTSDIEEVVESIESELALHASNMMSPADLAAAQTEETRHEGELNQLISDAMTQQNNLGTNAADFVCPHHAEEMHSH